MELKFTCRPMHVDDLSDVMRIQSEAYVDEICESETVISSRFAKVPDRSWVVENEIGTCGYLMGYFSNVGTVTQWGAEFIHKADADYLYLHDLAISKAATGYRLGPLLVGHASLYARHHHLSGIALVSVQNSKRFWEKMGFREFVDLTLAQRENLASYAGPAFYMTQTFS